MWGEKNERPICNEVINLLGVGKDDQVPFFISVHGTQLKPVRAYLSALGLRKKSLFEYQATMSLYGTDRQNCAVVSFIFQLLNILPVQSVPFKFHIRTP